MLSLISLHILISSSWSSTVMARSTTDTLFLSFFDTFVIKLQILDTIRTKKKIYVYEYENRKRSDARILEIKIDSIIKILNSGIYNGNEELMKVRYLAIPKHIRLPNKNHHIITTTLQRSKKYLIFGRYAGDSCRIIIDFDFGSTKEVCGYFTGLERVPRPNLFWRFLYNLDFVSESLYFEKAFNSKKQIKDPILQVIKRYERKSKRK